jgi:enoyl-CoA hydratase/carnithine racemase
VGSAAGLRVEVDGGVARLTLDRPEQRNAQTPALWRALAAVPQALDPGVRVVVVRAEGPSFSAGLDRRMFTPDGVPGEPSLAALAAMDDATLDLTLTGFQRAFTWLRDPTFVSVAAVQGHAVGAGFQLALACDLLLVADDAQLSLRETTLGLVPDLGGTHPLVRALGLGRALELCATGRPMDAAEAVATGLALAAVPVDGLVAATDALVDRMLAAPRDALTSTHRLLFGATVRTYEQQLVAEREAQAARLRALTAKRNPPDPSDVRQG